MEKIIVNKEDKQVLVNFDMKFYPSGCILKATQDFSDSCWISVDYKDDNSQVVLRPKSEEISLCTLGYEFYNYVLSIIKNEGKIQEIVKNFR